MVYALLEDEFKKGLHAVNIVTRTPEEHGKVESQ
jgi:stress-induced morphogen